MPRKEFEITDEENLGRDAHDKIKAKDPEALEAVGKYLVEFPDKLNNSLYPFDKIFLEAAINAKNLEVVNLLFENGVKVDDGRIGASTLYRAVNKMNPEIVKTVAEKSSLEDLGHVAIEILKNQVGAHGNDWKPEILGILLSEQNNCRNYKGKPIEDTSDGSTKGLLHLAVAYNSGVGVVECLLKYGFNVNKLEGAEGEPALHGAVYRDNEGVVDFLLAKGADPNIQNGGNMGTKGDKTPLHIAARYCRTNMIGKLIEAGAQVGSLDENGRTPLHTVSEASIMEGKKDEVVRILVKNGADLNALDHEGNALIHLFTKGLKHKEVAFLVDEMGVSIDQKTAKGETPLDLAINKSLELSFLTPDFDVFIERCANKEVLFDVAFKQGWGITLNRHFSERIRAKFHSAIKENDEAGVTSLLEKGARFDLHDFENRAVLDSAIANGGLHGVVKTLIFAEKLAQKGEKFKVEKSWKWETFWEAVTEGKAQDVSKGTRRVLKGVVKEALKRVTDKGALFNLVDSSQAWKSTGIEIKEAEKAGFKGIASALKDWKAKEESKLPEESLGGAAAAPESHSERAAMKEESSTFNESGNSVLFSNLSNLLMKGDARGFMFKVSGDGDDEDFECTDVLLESDGNGMTLLHFAALVGAERVVNFLLDEGADINARTKSGDTALHLAARIDNQSSVEKLVEKSADLFATNRGGKTPLDVARESSKWNIVGFLEDQEEQSVIPAAGARVPSPKPAAVSIESGGSAFGGFQPDSRSQ